MKNSKPTPKIITHDNFKQAFYDSLEEALKEFLVEEKPIWENKIFKMRLIAVFVDKLLE